MLCGLDFNYSLLFWWQKLLFGQPLQPQPHEVLPCFLSFIILKIIALTTKVTISNTIIEAKFSKITAI